MIAAVVPLAELVLDVEQRNPARDGRATFCYIDISSVDQATKNIIYRDPMPVEEAPSRARQEVRALDVLVSTVRPNLNAVAMVPPSLDGATASTGFCVLRPKPGQLDSRYLFHWVRTQQFVGYLTGRATGASYPAVSDKIILGNNIPLPPLAEQKRIAAVLDKADELRAKRRHALATLDTLLQSVFLDMFGDPVTNLKGWPTTTVDDVATYVSSGITPRGGSEVYQPSGVLFIRSQNVLMGRFDFSDVAYVTPRLHASMARSSVNRGDVLLNITGASIGRVHWFDGPNGSANVNQHVCIIRLDNAKMLPEYVAQHLAMPSYQIRIIGQNAGATRQAFNYQQIRRFSLMNADLEAQRRFASATAAVARLRKRAEEAITSTDDLFASIQSAAFAGTLFSSKHAARAVEVSGAAG